MRQVGSGESSVGSEQFAGGSEELQTDKSETLPKGWVTTELENCTKILDGFRKPVNSKERSKRIMGKKNEELFPYYGATGQVGYIDSYLIDGRFVLIGEDGAPFLDSNKNIAYIVDGKIWVNNHAHILDSLTGNSFLCHYLNQFNFTGYVTGTTRLKLTQGKLKEIPISLPPLNEQKRIVAKLDAIIPRIDSVKTRLDKVPILIKRFRQSVLTAAVTGKLTEKWRGEHPEVESAEETFNKFHVKTKQKISNFSKNLKGELSLPDVPLEWFWIKLPDTGKMGRGKSKHRPRNAPHLYGGKYPFIQTGDVAQSNGLITTHKQTYSEAGLTQSKLWPKDTICITIAANIADSSILTYPACFPDSIVGIEADNKICETNFITYYIRIIRENLSMFAPATAQKNINLSILNEVMFPLPPIEEQKEIVRQVDKLFALADKLETHYKNAKASIDKLSQSVLAKAFRGELVPQDPNDEPAEKLLERIMKEKAKMEGALKVARKKTIGKRGKK